VVTESWRGDVKSVGVTVMRDWEGVRDVGGDRGGGVGGMKGVKGVGGVGGVGGVRGVGGVLGIGVVVGGGGDGVVDCFFAPITLVKDWVCACCFIAVCSGGDKESVVVDGDVESEGNVEGDVEDDVVEGDVGGEGGEGDGDERGLRGTISPERVVFVVDVVWISFVGAVVFTWLGERVVLVVSGGALCV
jgi:hypothetical protein